RWSTSLMTCRCTSTTPGGAAGWTSARPTTCPTTSPPSSKGQGRVNPHSHGHHVQPRRPTTHETGANMTPEEPSSPNVVPEIARSPGQHLVPPPCWVDQRPCEVLALVEAPLLRVVSQQREPAAAAGRAMRAVEKLLPCRRCRGAESSVANL